MDRLMAIVVFLLCATAAIIGVRSVLLALSMRRWLSAEGEVRSSGVLGVDSGASARMYRPEIVYAFSVGGIEYTGARRTLFPIQAGGTGYAEEVAGQYLVGQRVTVYYNPQNPRESILNRKTALPMAALLTALATYMSATILLWFVRHLG